MALRPFPFTVLEAFTHFLDFTHLYSAYDPPNLHLKVNVVQLPGQRFHRALLPLSPVQKHLATTHTIAWLRQLRASLPKLDVLLHAL